MNTPEVPPQPPADAVPAMPATDPPATVSDASPNGHSSSDRGNDAVAGPATSAVDTAHEDHAHEGGAEGEGGSEPAVDATAPAGTEKKRRRRRRKKKPGAQSSAPEGESGDAHESGSAEGPSEETASADGEHTVLPEKRQKKKERRPGPPRERPPVNAGDIVFGKILEITDDAILIDIPGKARAIFDRREMLLPDDDEPARPSRQPSAPSAEETPSSDAATTETVVSGTAAGDEPAPVGEEAAVATASVAPLAAEAHADVPTAQAEPIEASSAEVAPPVEAIESPAEPPKEPKVPHVILEVGTDFIGVVYGDGSRGGLVVLTHHPHRAERTKPIVEKAAADGTTIEGLVTGVIKGGIEVDVDGLRAFAPGSHVDLRLGADLSHLVGKRLSFLVTQYAKRGRDVVLSRRSMLEEEARKARAEALARLKVGEDLDGVVRSVVAFGAFVDVGGIEGLVPLQEMSHNRADSPSDVFKAGEPTRVKVLKIDDRGKVWLSRKATIADPWQQVAQKYALGTRHQGKVARLHPFGAFVELEPGVDGLIHTQDLSIKRIEAPEEVTKVGETIDVVVAHVDPSQHKIGLHPAPQGDAGNEVAQRVAPHKPVKAKVVLVESGGVLVRILGVTGRAARGYVTAAGTGTPRGTELRKIFSVGQEIEAKVIEIDPRRGEAKLSIKALSDDQERSAYQQYRQQLKAEARFTFGDLLAKKNSPSR
jgi:small subunit ribosomal protein S1